MVQHQVNGTKRFVADPELSGEMSLMATIWKQHTRTLEELVSILDRPRSQAIPISSPLSSRLEVGPGAQFARRTLRQPLSTWRQYTAGKFE